MPWFRHTITGVMFELDEATALRRRSRVYRDDDLEPLDVSVFEGDDTSNTSSQDGQPSNESSLDDGQSPNELEESDTSKESEEEANTIVSPTDPKKRSLK